MVGVALWKLPQVRGSAEQLLWIVPSCAFGALFAYRFARAPFELHVELQQQLAEASAKRRVAEEALRDQRHFKAIADYLTDRQSYGTHQLLHMPPQSEDQLEEWSRWVKNWLEEVMIKLRQFGCSPQELNSVNTIAVNDLPLVSGSAIEVALKMHYVRLQRIEALAKSYAERAIAASI
jgi:hypothetical protein